MLFSFVLDKNLLTASMAQLVRDPDSEAFVNYLTLRPGHSHTKTFNYEMIYLRYKFLKFLREKSNSSLHLSKTSVSPKQKLFQSNSSYSASTKSLQK